jgi:hypothetical protein
MAQTRPTSTFRTRAVEQLSRLGRGHPNPPNEGAKWDLATEDMSRCLRKTEVPVSEDEKRKET